MLRVAGRLTEEFLKTPFRHDLESRAYLQRGKKISGNNGKAPSFSFVSSVFL